jgi:hypothetical protein
LQDHRPLFFHRLIKTALLFASRLGMVMLKTIFMIVTGFPKLRVERIVVNDAFLLANGMLVIHWRVKNALWVRVDGKFMGSRENQVLVLAAKGRRMISIRVQGLFNSYRIEYHVDANVELMITPLGLPRCTISLESGRLYPVFSQILHNSIGFTGRDFLHAIPPVAITIPSIPSIQTENQHETRLLHHP